MIGRGGVVALANTVTTDWSTRLRRHLDAFAAIDAETMRRLAMAVLVVQLAASFAAFATQVMLHGDGAYFVYALSEGEPWLLKWRDISARAAVYLTTVAPTEFLATIFNLSPVGIGRLNGLIFYLVPTLQFAIAAAMVWRSHPQYLLFPVAQYVFSSEIGFGYPSEILLAPGFLWIALFLVLKDRAVSIWFAIAFLALIFSHELAIPAALIVAYLAFSQASRQDAEAGSWWRRAWIALIVFGGLAAFVAVRLNGGGTGSDNNAIYVIDPRRIVNNPTMWTIILAVAIALAIGRRFHALLDRKGALVAFAALALIFPIALRIAFPEIDYEQGRYDSARSIVGFFMVLLAACFAVLGRPHAASPQAIGRSAGTHAALVAYVALAVGMGAGMAFLYDWSVVLDRLAHIVGPAQADGRLRFISYEDSRKLMPSWEAELSDRMDFHWVLPFRSIVLADGADPGQIVFDDADYRFYCGKAERLNPISSRIPLNTLNEMRRFACTHEPPAPIVTKSSRFFAWLRGWL